MSAHNVQALFERVQPGWSVLQVGDPIPGLDERVGSITSVTPDTLPLAGHFDLITCRDVIAQVPDAFALLQQCASLLTSGGTLWLEDALVPEYEAAAHYVSAFYRFHAGGNLRFYAEYEWRGLLLDTDFAIESLEITAEERVLSEWAGQCSPYVVERLHIMLRQAPAAVRDWLQPQLFGPQEATFSQHRVQILAKKPL